MSLSILDITRVATPFQVEDEETILRPVSTPAVRTVLVPMDRRTFYVEPEQRTFNVVHRGYGGRN